MLGLFSSKQIDHFFSRSRNEYFTADDEYGPGKGIYFYQSFKLDKEYDIYERSVYTFAGLLQDVGGFYNSLFFVGLIIYSRFKGSYYFAYLISQLYFVEKTNGHAKGYNHKNASLRRGSRKTKLFESTDMS